MSAQSFLAKNGMRLGALGSNADLAIAAPLAAGDPNPAAHTDATRIGWFFTRGGTPSVGEVVNGATLRTIDSTGESLVPRLLTVASASGTEAIKLEADATRVGLNIGQNNSWANSVAGMGGVMIGRDITNFCPNSGTSNLLVGKGIGVTANFNNTVLIGMSYTLGASSHANAILLVNGGTVGSCNDSIIIGRPDAVGATSVLVGRTARTTTGSVAIGNSALATGANSVALGRAADAASFVNAVAIGYQAAATKANQIRLGNATNHTEISIPTTTTATDSTTGALVIGGGIGAGGSIFANGGLVSARDGVSDSAKLSADGGGGWVQFYQSGGGAYIARRAGGASGLRLGYGTPTSPTDCFALLGTALATGSAEVYYTTAATSTATGALIVAGGIGAAGDSYIRTIIVDGTGLHVSTGVNNASDAGVHVNRPNQGGAGTAGGIVLTQSGIGDRRLYLTGNDGTFSFNIGGYSNQLGSLQFGGQTPQALGIAALLCIGPTGTRQVPAQDANNAVRIRSNVDPGAWAAAADANGYDTYFRTQGGGAHTVNNPRGADLVFVAGAAGAGGTGRAGRLESQSVVFVSNATASTDAVTGAVVISGGLGVTGRVNTVGTISTGDTLYTTHQINIGGSAASQAIRAYRANANGGGWQVDLTNAKPSMWFLNSSAAKLLKIGLTNQSSAGGGSLVIGYGTGDPGTGDTGIVMANGGYVTIRTTSDTYNNLTLTQAGEGGAPTSDNVYMTFQSVASPGVGNGYGILSSYIAKGATTDYTIGRIGFRTGAAWAGGTYDSNFVVRTLVGGVAADRLTVEGANTFVKGILVSESGRRCKLTQSGANINLSQNLQFLELTADSITATLWAAPVTGDTISIRNKSGTGNCSVSGNGKNIEGSAGTFTLADGESATFVYNGTEWTIF